MKLTSCRVLSISRRNFSIQAARAAKFQDLSEVAICRPLIQLRDRPYLAGSESTLLNEYISKDPNKYFKGISLNPTDKDEDLGSIGNSIAEYVGRHLQTHSGFLIKGLPLKKPLDFQQLVKGMKLDPIVYDAGNASRQTVDEHVYTASDEPKEISIEPHNELSYFEENYPTKIMFFCMASAEEGGDSPVTFNRDVMKSLNQEMIEKIKKRKIRYIRNLNHEHNSNYLTWQETFKSKDKKKVESIMKRENMGWEWKENGNLCLWNITKATITHPRTGEEIWFNQLTASHCTYYKTMPKNVNNQDLHPDEYTLNTCYGDGEQFEPEVIDNIRAALWNNSMSLKLQRGDLLILDNLLALHSRMSYEGGKREIIVHLTQ